jgi:hypothetical protein
VDAAVAGAAALPALAALGSAGAAPDGFAGPLSAAGAAAAGGDTDGVDVTASGGRSAAGRTGVVAGDSAGAAVPLTTAAGERAFWYAMKPAMPPMPSTARAATTSRPCRFDAAA